MAMNVTEIVLKKPVTAHNEMLHVLELREPTYDEIEALGFPFIISGEGSIKLDSRGTEIYPVAGGDPAFIGGADGKTGYF